MKIELFKRCIINEYNYGFLGEVYMKIDEMKNCSKKLLDKYFSLKSPYYCNRNNHYYSTDISDIFRYLPTYTEDIKSVVKSQHNNEMKRFLIFSITSHLLNDIAKLIGVVYAHTNLREEFLPGLQSYLLQITEYYVRLIFKEQISVIEKFDHEILKSMQTSISELDNIQVRECSQMDHPLIMITSFFAYEEFLKDRSLILAPLQGASIIPAMFISMYRYLYGDESQEFPSVYEYMRVAYYDDSYFLDISLQEQVEYLSNKYGKSDAIVVIDDNTSTARTIRTLKTALEIYFEDVRTCVLECRWETKINNLSYPAFDMNDVCHIAPLEYRHYMRFAEELTYLCESNELNNHYYSESFYNLDYVYNKYDFEDIIQKSEINELNKERFLKVIDNHKLLMQCRSHNTTCKTRFQNDNSTSIVAHSVAP